MSTVTAPQAIVYGIVQGLTEFLPISSTGHLRIASAFAGWEDPGAAFTAVIQLGTLLAVLVYFRTDLWRLVVATLKSIGTRDLSDPDAKLGWGITIGTIPIVIVGFALKDAIEGPARDLRVIAAGLGLFSIVLFIADRRGGQAGRDGVPVAADAEPRDPAARRELRSASVVDAVAIGAAQVLALIPGVSRSGSTISMGLFRGFDRSAAARFSFLLSVPAVVLSGLFELRKVGDPGGAALGPTVIATVVSFVLGYASIAGLLRLLAKRSLTAFVIYRIAMAALLVVLLSTNAIQAR